MRVTTKLLGAAAAGLLLAVTAGARDGEQHHEYACEVQTQAGVAGLVVIQATGMDKARQAAAQAPAYTIGGERSPAMSVLECIERPGGRFRDSQFQRFYERYGSYEVVLD